MVKWYGMSEQIGPISFFPGNGTDPRAADFMEKPYSKMLGNLIDQVRFVLAQIDKSHQKNKKLQEIGRLVSKAYFTTENLLRENKDKLDKVGQIRFSNHTFILKNFSLLQPF